MLNPSRYPFKQNAGSYPFNQNAGSYPFNQNAGAILSKRNYINRKLDEIEQKLIELGWMEEPAEEEEQYTDEFIESAGALIPYRNEVNQRLDFYESIIKQHLEPSQQPTTMKYPQTIQPQPPSQQSQQVEEAFKNNFASIFG
jgi:hypothetical protein